MEGRGGQQQVRFLLQQGPVGGQACPEALLRRDSQQLPQLRVEQGLSHDVEIQIACVSP